MSRIQVAVLILDDLLMRSRGTAVTEHERDLLLKRSRSLAQDSVTELEKLFDAAMKGFMEAAAEGVSYNDVSRIRERYGRTLEDNYPEAGDEFLRLARTYWTFKITLDDLFVPDDYEIGAPNFLGEIERVVGSVFFPVYGPMKINPDRREQTQRHFLRKYASRIDADALIEANPILIRDRSTTGPDFWRTEPKELEDPSVLGFVRSNLRVYFFARREGFNHSGALVQMWASRYIVDGFEGEWEKAIQAARRQVESFLETHVRDTEYQHLDTFLHSMYIDEVLEDGFPIEEDRLSSTLSQEVKRYSHTTGVRVGGL